MTEHPDFATVPEITLGWRIQMALAAGNLKHKDLVEKFEVSRETVSRWCRDIGLPPKKFVLNEIAVMCGVSPRWLIDGITPDPGPGGPGECPQQGSNLRPADYKSVIVPFSVRRIDRAPGREPDYEAA